MTMRIGEKIQEAVDREREKKRGWLDEDFISPLTATTAPIPREYFNEYVEDPSIGTVRIRINADDIANETIISSRKVQPVATKKYVANLVIEENVADQYKNGQKINLMAIQLTDDDLAEVLRKAHGHLDLVPDGKQESGARGVSA